LWPAVRAARLFPTEEEFNAFRLTEPWRVRVTERGEGLVLSAWRRHLGVLAVRGLWASRPRVPVLAREVVAVAADHGFTSVLSPLHTIEALEPYTESGFRVTERLVVLQGLVDDVVASGGASSTPAIGDACSADLPALAVIDSWSFDTFWGYREPELLVALASEKFFVARDDAGEAVGYATCAHHSGNVTVGRLAVAPDARRSGIGGALLRQCALWAVEQEAFAITLCTQEDNTGSRALYARSGMHELSERYALAVCDARGAAPPRLF